MGKAFEPMSMGKHPGLVEEVVAFVKGDGLLRGGGAVGLPWGVIRNLDEAKRVAWETPIGEQELLWSDLREHQMAEIRRTTYDEPELTTIRDSLSSNLTTFTFSVRRKLNDTHQELFDDIVGDLCNCAFNRAIIGATGFFELLFEAYRSGGWPCGWIGNFPSGRLLVYFPNQ